MITLDLNRGATKLYTAQVIQGGFSDLLQLTQPRKPIATDWAEEPRLDTVQTTLEPQPTRPLRLDVWLPKGTPHSDLQRIDTLQVSILRLYNVQIREVHERDRFPDGSIYTLRGTILQDKIPTTDPTADLKQSTASKEYTITTQRIPLATFGASPLEGWEAALMDKTAYKETSPEASRDITLPILLQGDTTDQLLNARDTLDALLYRESRNQLTTPYGHYKLSSASSKDDTPFGTHRFYFTRSKIREYNITDKPCIIYDLTLTLV